MIILNNMRVMVMVIGEKVVIKEGLFIEEFVLFKFCLYYVVFWVVLLYDNLLFEFLFKLKIVVI